MKTPGTSSTELKPAQKFSRTSKVLGGVVCFILLFGSFYTIPSGQVGLESTLGVYQRQHKSPGLYFKFPIKRGFF